MRFKHPDERLVQPPLAHAHKDFPRIPLGHSVAQALATVQKSPFFISVVLALAESVSGQSLTLTLQAQHGTRIAWNRVLAALARELPLGIALGGICGLLVGTVAWLWQWQLGVAVTILASIMLSVTTATVLGLLVPSASSQPSATRKWPPVRSRWPIPTC